MWKTCIEIFIYFFLINCDELTSDPELYIQTSMFNCQNARIIAEFCEIWQIIWLFHSNRNGKRLIYQEDF